jgi:Na+/H+ antiporter NhaD/arsenite permease-like protein
MLIRFKSTADKFYQAVDWDLLAFFAALFVVIFVMEHAQVLTLIGKGIDPIIKLGAKTGAGLLLVTSAAASSVTDNIPLAAMLSKILANMKIPTESGLWWSVIFGANLGGNLTPIGSASTLVAVTIIHKQQINFPFGAFVIKALPFALFQIALATVYVILFLS